MDLTFQEIKSFQLFLKQKGYYSGAIDGAYGPRTNAAVKAFQKSVDLTADGIVGDETLRQAVYKGYRGLDYPLKPKDIFPIGREGREILFGKFRFEAGADLRDADAVTIKGDWEDKNIVTIVIPQIARFNGSGKVRCHRLIAKQLTALWQAWEDKDLLKYVLTWEGCFYPRFIRGAYGVLSNHSWGSAFDINAQWNGLNKEPAYIGEKGCVRELVDTALDFGFYWGGWFNRQDGMHFEVFKIIE